LFEKYGVVDVNVVTGYLSEKVDQYSIAKFYNPKFDSTNMVATLFTASELFDGQDDILISYGDIAYSERVFESVLEADDLVNVVVDKNWKTYWEARMVDPLRDLETLKIGGNGKITELGKKPKSYEEVQGQYIGLIKIRRDIVERVKLFYEGLDRHALYDGKDYSNMYMTSFLQSIANEMVPLSPVFIEGGWVEIDEPSDLKFGHFLRA
jgi:choline kinase